MLKKANIKKQICILGLGHIGLPTACILATSGYSVLGVDIDEKVIIRAQSADLSRQEPKLQNLLIRAIHSGNFKISKQAASAAIYIIAVPTPLGPDHQPDLSAIYAVVEAIRPWLQADNLVLIESTCPIGTTDIITKKLRYTCPRIQIAYCPERVLPGNILHELIHNDRVVGGVDDTSSSHAVSFYKSFVRGDVLVTDARTAEAVKLAENTYRDINIAYANELSMIADRIKLDANELIRLANRHPRVQILQPGPGVGGHCIALDPWFLVASAPDLAMLTLKAREVNSKKTDWVIAKVSATIKANSASVIACLGLSYKPNSTDLRQSPALAIVQTLEMMEIEVLRVDPYIANTVALYDALARAEIIVGLVAHDAFLNIPPKELTGKLILDFAGVFK